MFKQKPTYRQYSAYLIFMLAACGGAFIWQLCLPQLGGQFTSWGSAPGWQREIALWNTGLIVAIVASLVKRNTEYAKILVIQATVLCWVLGVNHLVSFVQNASAQYLLHIMGVFEVLLLGGIWGLVLVCRLLFAGKAAQSGAGRAAK
ncbi:MAG: hypothetical protein ACK5L3_05580 [Oscillospiraceae bacterium]